MAHERRPDHAPVSRDEDACVPVHGRSLVMFESLETRQRDERVAPRDLEIGAHHFLHEDENVVVGRQPSFA